MIYIKVLLAEVVCYIYEVNFLNGLRAYEDI